MRIYPSGAMITVTSGHGDFRQLSELPRSIGGMLSRMEQIGGSMADADLVGAVGDPIVGDVGYNNIAAGVEATDTLHDEVKSNNRTRDIVCSSIFSRRLLGAGALIAEGRVGLPPPPKFASLGSRRGGAQICAEILIGMDRLYRRVWALILNTKV